MVTADEARRELARRELERRRGGATKTQDAGGTFMDVLKSGATGVANGAADLVGLPGTISGLLDSGFDWGMDKIKGDEPGTAAALRASVQPTNPTSGDALRSGLSTITGGATDYQPKTTAGEYASTVGEFLPGAAVFGPLNPSNLLRFGVLPGMASEGAGQLTEGSAAEPYARIAAALLAPAAPSALRRAVTPFPASPERIAAANRLAAEGVPLTAGQRTGNKALRYAEGELGGTRAAQAGEAQAEAFTSAAMTRAGAGGRATPDNMAANEARLSQGFDDISSRNTVRADPDLARDFTATMTEYMRVLPTEQREIVRNIAQDIVARFRTGNGTISGRDYQNFRSRLSKRSQNARGNDNELAQAYRGLRNALDSAMERSVNPADAAEWATLRRQWGNNKVLENAANGGGEDAAMGLISPARLRMSAATGNRGGYARGEGDFSELAHAGQATMTPLPNSGTAGRLKASGLLPGLGALAGNAPGMIAGMLAPRAAGALLMSRPGQAYLGNQLMPGLPISDRRYAAIIAALLDAENGKRPRLGTPQ